MYTNLLTSKSCWHFEPLTHGFHFMAIFMYYSLTIFNNLDSKHGNSERRLNPHFTTVFQAHDWHFWSLNCRNPSGLVIQLHQNVASKDRPYINLLTFSNMDIGNNIKELDLVTRGSPWCFETLTQGSHILDIFHGLWPWDFGRSELKFEIPQNPA